MRLTEEDLSVLDDEGDNLPTTATSPIDSPLDPENFKSDHTPIKVEKSLHKEIDGDVNRDVLRQELENYDMYLHNLHKGFPMATSVRALLQLTDGALRINKQRRATIEHALKMRAASVAIPEFDAMGNIKK